MVEIELTDEEFDTLDPEKQKIIERYSRPIPASHRGRRRFKISIYWAERIGLQPEKE